MWPLTMSVNGRTVNSDGSFPSFLHAHVDGHQNLFFDPHRGLLSNRFAPPRESPQLFSIMDGRASTPAASVGHRLYGSEPTIFHHPHYPHRRFSEHPSVGVDPRTILNHDHYFSNPLASSKVESAQPLLQQAMPAPLAHAYYPFRPSEPSTTILPAIPAPTKIDTSPPLPTPTVLVGEVDQTKYEPVDYEEWLKAPTDYTASPPESANSPTDEGPSTPPDFQYVDPGLRRDSAHDHSEVPYLHAFTPNSFQAALEKIFPERHDRISDTPGPFHLPGGYYSTPALAHASNHIAPAHSATNRFGPATASASPEEIVHPVYIHRPASTYSTSSVSADQTSVDGQSPAPTLAPASAPDHAAEHNERNELLLELRNHGHSYKEIKRMGRFREAESTLRGRVRMLTKEKWERVRKPEWKNADVALLRRAVKHYRQEGVGDPSARRGTKKIPWKKVGEWMQEHGSSYTFAPATCAKKWADTTS